MVPAPKAEGSLSVETSKMAEYLGDSGMDFLHKFQDDGMDTILGKMNRKSLVYVL